ncbi:MAG: bacillithiol system redox-active protein YtxJ [Chitinophagia bacterium]|jgi:bacillithiol system protein YtxJ
MQWIPLNDLSQLDKIQQSSFTIPQVIFKHSTTCSISQMAFARMERSEAPDTIQFYYLDLLNFRPISKAIAEKFSVSHESPQILLIKNGECIFDESHGGIFMEEIIEQAAL